MKRATLSAMVAAAGVLGGIGSYLVARAAGPTSPVPLHYGGFLTQGSTPVDVDKNIHVFLYDVAATGQGNLLCKDAETAAVPVHEGHFSVAMETGCEAALKGNGTAWTEVQVDGAAIGPRQPVGAVPYAISSEQATNADNATAAASVPFTGVTGIGPTTAWTGRVSQLDAGARIIGATTASTDGAPGGYPALLTMCQTQFGARAYPCTGTDAVRSLMQGNPGMVTTPGHYWIALGALAIVNTQGADDCSGFSKNASGDWGATMMLATGVWRPSADVCTQSHPVLCCSYP